MLHIIKNILFNFFKWFSFHFYNSIGLAPVAIAFIRGMTFSMTLTLARAIASGCGLLPAQSFQRGLESAGRGAPCAVSSAQRVGFVCLVSFVGFIKFYHSVFAMFTDSSASVLVTSIWQPCVTMFLVVALKGLPEMPTFSAKRREIITVACGFNVSLSWSRVTVTKLVAPLVRPLPFFRVFFIP